MSVANMPLGVLGTAAQQAIQQALNNIATGATGSVFYLDPVNGSDSNNGLAAQAGSPGSGIGPVQSLAAGYALLVDGHNDTLVLIGNGASTGSARITTFTWKKSATRLIGVCAPSAVSQRARIANPTTSGLTITANFFTISGSGCLFQNISWFQGAGAGQTGIAAAILVTCTGSRNAFINCDFEGMGDSTSATDAGSRCLLISAGGQENFFSHCNFGLDTVTRTNANATVEVSGGGPRNIFEDCTFPFLSSDGLQYAFLAAGAAAMDRWVLFKRCNVIATNAGSGLAIAQAFKLAASVGGILCLDSGSGMFNVTAIGDATTKAQCFVSGGTATNGVKGIVAT
jgi:hypothetical protein